MIKLIERLKNEQRGISAVIFAVVLLALFGAAMLSVDAGSLWTARRNVITASDAAALNAARYFNTGGGNPCDATSIQQAETDAASVMLQNNQSALHNATDTPDGFQVTPAGLCGVGGYMPGKVRFDARLASHQSFSQIFGFNQSSAIASSTAAWGYITGIGNGLRPLAVCDQNNINFPALPVPAGQSLVQYWSSYHPHYFLWNELWHGLITQSDYDSFFGTDANNYPSVSSGFLTGDTNRNPNLGRTYITPNGTNEHHLIQRITMPDQNCGYSPGNRLLVDLRGQYANGGPGASTIRQWLLTGYPGTVSLTPHDCGPDHDPAVEDCGAATGDRNTLTRALQTITCDYNTVATSCPYVFPIVVFQNLHDPGSTGGYEQVAFLFVVIRGFGDLDSNNNMQIDYEFVDQQVDGNVSLTPPSTVDAYQTGIQLCGADHDSTTDRCGF